MVTARQNWIERCTSRILPLSIGVFRLKIALLVSEELCLQAKPRLCPEKETEEKEKERIIIHKRKQCPELIINKFRPMTDVGPGDSRYCLITQEPIICWQ